MTERCGKQLRNGDICCRKIDHTSHCHGTIAQAKARENRKNNPDMPAQRRAAVKRWKYRNREHRSATLAVARAKAQGLPYVTIPELMATLGPVPEVCPILGIELNWSTNQGPSMASPSIDKIKPELGYVPGNVRWLSHRANMLKSNATADELWAVLVDSVRTELDYAD